MRRQTTHPRRQARRDRAKERAEATAERTDREQLLDLCYEGHAHCDEVKRLAKRLGYTSPDNVPDPILDGHPAEDGVWAWMNYGDGNGHWFIDMDTAAEGWDDVDAEVIAMDEGLFDIGQED
jgi:hypothetical protein